MRVAVIGAGIAGISAADALSISHEVTLFEAAERLGGHTNTVTLEVAGEPLRVDTGFIVFNERNYPTFCGLLERWDVPSQPSDMSFSVTVASTGLEYSGAGLGGLFAQRSNLVSPAHYRLLFEILRFGRRGAAVLAEGSLSPEVTTEDFLRAEGFSSRFREEYLIPLGAAVWSADPGRFTGFPAVSLLRFLDNHGLLLFRDRPRWQTIVGGSSRYLDRFAETTSAQIRLGTPVRSVRRELLDVAVVLDQGEERFDEVVLCVHSDEALSLLADPTAAETAILGAIRYQSNDAVLHTDSSLLPSRRRAWASWNYHLDAQPSSVPTLTYWMNRLQRLETPVELLVTLNRTEAIDPTTILGTFAYRHPVYDVGAFEAQRRLSEISGVNRTWYAGAWCGFGFHEDGAASGARAAEALRR